MDRRPKQREKDVFSNENILVWTRPNINVSANFGRLKCHLSMQLHERYQIRLQDFKKKNLHSEANAMLVPIISGSRGYVSYQSVLCASCHFVFFMRNRKMLIFNKVNRTQCHDFKL